MSSVLGSENVCGFCGSEDRVFSEVLGDMEVYICVDCVTRLNAGASRQGVDAANVTGAVALQDRKLAVQLFGFKKLIDVSSNDAALVAGQISDFFLAMHEAIASGKLAEMKAKQDALRTLREGKREALKDLPALTAAVVKTRTALSSAEQKLADVLAEKAEAENQLAAAQSAEELIGQKIKAAELEDLRLVNEVRQTLDALGASGVF